MSHLTEFAEILNQQMQKVRKAGEQTVLELGSINDDLSLAIDGLKDRIPKGEYLVSLHIKGLSGDQLHSLDIAHTHSGGRHSQYTGDGVHSHSDGTHHHVLPETLRGIIPGDRVLVAWVGGQPIVLDILAGS